VAGPETNSTILMTKFAPPGNLGFWGSWGSLGFRGSLGFWELLGFRESCICCVFSQERTDQCVLMWLVLYFLESSKFSLESTYSSLVPRPTPFFVLWFATLQLPYVIVNANQGRPGNKANTIGHPAII